MSALRCIGGGLDTATHQANCPVHMSRSTDPSLTARWHSGPLFMPGPGLQPIAPTDPVASLLLVLQDLKDSCHTAVEKRATEDCIEAVREAFGVSE